MFNLKEKIVKPATKVFTSARDTAQGVVRNTINDIEALLSGAGGCIDYLNDIGKRVINRSIEYQTGAIRMAIDLNIIPIELINDVISFVGGQIRRDPNPRIFHLKNPYEYVYVKDIGADIEEINVDTFTFPTNRWPLVYIHGASSFNGRLITRALGFFFSFEQAARMFNPSSTSNSLDYRSNADVYLVSYDGRMLNTDRVKIRNGFARKILDTVTQVPDVLFSAVYWREMERRAEITARKKVLPFFEKLPDWRGSGTVPMLISHSLGCHVAASAAHQFKASSDKLIFQSWLCMAPAIPVNSFSNTGAFQNAPAITGRDDGIRYGTSVWYNPADIVLPAYNLVSGNLALGQTGAFDSKEFLANINTFPYVGVVHEAPIGGNRDYFDLLRDVLRGGLNTNPASGLGNRSIRMNTDQITTLKKIRKKAPLYWKINEENEE